jgi:threonine dehydratase
VAEVGANIEEVHHQRAFSMLSAQKVEVELLLQTRNPAHVRDVIAALQGAGFEAAAY